MGEGEKHANKNYTINTIYNNNLNSHDDDE